MTREEEGWPVEEAAIQIDHSQPTMNPFLNPYPQETLDQAMEEMREDLSRRQQQSFRATLQQQSEDTHQVTGHNGEFGLQRNESNQNTFGDRKRTLLRTSSVESFHSIKSQGVKTS